MGRKRKVAWWFRALEALGAALQVEQNVFGYEFSSDLKRIFGSMEGPLSRVKFGEVSMAEESFISSSQRYCTRCIQAHERHKESLFAGMVYYQQV